MHFPLWLAARGVLCIVHWVALVCGNFKLGRIEYFNILDCNFRGSHFWFPWRWTTITTVSRSTCTMLKKWYSNCFAINGEGWWHRSLNFEGTVTKPFEISCHLLWFSAFCAFGWVGTRSLAQPVHAVWCPVQLFLVVTVLSYEQKRVLCSTTLCWAQSHEPVLSISCFLACSIAATAQRIVQTNVIHSRKKAGLKLMWHWAAVLLSFW